MDGAPTAVTAPHHSSCCPAPGALCHCAIPAQRSAPPSGTAAPGQPCRAAGRSPAPFPAVPAGGSASTGTPWAAVGFVLRRLRCDCRAGERGCAFTRRPERCAGIPAPRVSRRCEPFPSLRCAVRQGNGAVLPSASPRAAPGAPSAAAAAAPTPRCAAAAAHSGAAQHSAAQHCTAQHCTAQHCTVQRSSLREEQRSLLVKANERNEKQAGSGLAGFHHCLRSLSRRLHEHRDLPVTRKMHNAKERTALRADSIEGGIPEGCLHHPWQ